jgi:peptidoglycan/xylan/chitin deacetylase (PgdA/CDA1 family)
MKRYRNILKRVFFLSGSLMVATWDWAIRQINYWRQQPNQARCIVLCYHSVPSHYEHRFRKQMQILRQLCVCIPADHRRKLEKGRRYVIISFDDGFLSVVHHALPILRDYKLLCTLFVPAGRLGAVPDWIDEEDHPDQFETVMSEDVLKQVASEDVLIGSHSMTHAYLTELSADQACDELVRSKIELERLTGGEVNLLAFPHGFYTDQHLELAKKAGYLRVFTLDPGVALFHSEEFITGRIDVGPHLLNWEFRLVLIAAYRWLPAYYRLKNILLSWFKPIHCTR